MTAKRSRTSLSLAARLVGTWELLSREDRTPTGERRIDPTLGPNPIGLLIYDRTGHFAAQFMKRERMAAAPAAVAAAVTPNNSRARDGYDAYFGTYLLDDEQGTVTQTLMGALSPENVGQVITRSIEVHGDELAILLQTSTSDGEPITRTLRWQRVA
jgi:hypothetical protein